MQENNINLTLSVVITNYNYGHFLEKCITSVLEQTYKPIEIIIADDASTDNSIEIIRKYELLDSRIRAIVNPVNLKLAKNKHNAILQAKGEYIRSIDSDDYLYNINVLKNEMSLIEEYRRLHNKDIISFSKEILVDKDGGKLQFYYKKIFQGDIFMKLLTKSYLARYFTMKKKQYLSVNGFDLNSKLYVDWVLRLKLASKYEYYYTNEEGTAYRQHGDGMSSSKDLYHLKWRRNAYKNVLPYLSRKEQIEAFFRFYLYYIRKLFLIPIKKITFLYTPLQSLKNKLLMLKSE